MPQQGAYQPPVDALLALGDPRAKEEFEPSPWRDYGALGLKERHVSELIRMATDEGLHDADFDNPAVWAPLHAWRALAQLRSVEAVDPLLKLMGPRDEADDDWYLEEFPVVFGMIGPPSLSPLASYLSDSANLLYPRAAAAGGLFHVAQHHSESRGASVAALTDQLARFEENPPELNAFLVCYLDDLKAVESAEVIERAYAARRVDESIVGSWGKIRQSLGVEGLGLAPDAPRQPSGFGLLRGARTGTPARSQGSAQRKQRRADRKHQRHRRRKNRKRR